MTWYISEGQTVYLIDKSAGHTFKKNFQAIMLVKNIVKQGLLLRNAGAMSRAAYHAGGHHQHSTMNDLPVPAGDWKEQYSQQNTKYNVILIAGVLVLAGTIGFVKSSGLVYFNYSPPKDLD
ncbi:uncharacterized protein COX7B isoform X2 [Drosophila pseudoobscura]|uniref:Uncharacterized protein COX7B isoform X2 n=1 Tax=Drosophila pseudoobscura pseudoobscura TaxID=46245 RepID=A0A6I8WCI2_DROPS|nr:uncharacterized protein LOC4813486 isoform X2 [Drosophila pseudoobscura]